MRTTTLIIGDEKGLRGPDPILKRKNVGELDAEFGRDVKARRIALGLRQKDICDLVGIHLVTMSRIETGQYRVNDAMRKSIKTVLDEFEA